MEVTLELIAELKERAKIQQPKELKAFDSLRLPIEDTVEATVEIFIEVLIKLKAEASLVVYYLGFSVS